MEESEAPLFSELSQEAQSSVDSLIWLGHIEDTFSFAGHTFTMRTLRGDEELAAGVIVREFIETFGQARAWAWAKIGLSLVAVDGNEAFCPPIGPDKIAYARARFRWVTEQWYWPLAEVLYSYFVELETRQLEAIRAAENLSRGSRAGSTPSADFSTEQGDSPETKPNSTPSKPDS
jgi:hypothetical protein